MALTREEDLSRLQNAERAKKSAEETIHEIRKKWELPDAILVGGGGDASTDPAGQLEKEDQNAVLFDKLSSAERTALYMTDRPRWQEIMRAKEAAGIRKLFRGNP